MRRDYVHFKSHTWCFLPAFGKLVFASLRKCRTSAFNRTFSEVFWTSMKVYLRQLLGCKKWLTANFSLNQNSRIQSSVTLLSVRGINVARNQIAKSKLKTNLSWLDQGSKSSETVWTRSRLSFFPQSDLKLKHQPILNKWGFKARISVAFATVTKL